MKALVLAGALPQIELLKQLKARGIETVLADGNERCLARPYADVFHKVAIFDVEAVKQVAVDEQVDFLITCCADQVLLIVAQVSEMLGLPCYLDYETAKMVSDKEIMKRVFVEHDVPTAHHVVMGELDMQKIAHLQYPLIVKPVDSYSSRGVRKVLCEQELQAAFADAVQISRTNTALVEEFCEGEEISVDVQVSNGKAHVLCISNSEKIKDADRFVIFRGRYPANVDDALCKEIERVAQKIADAFGLHDSPMLIQMISDGKRVFVLEFCARTGGNMKFLLIKHVCGFDVISGVIDLTLGLKPEVVVRPPENKYIVNDFIYCNAGIYDHLECFDELMAEGTLSDYHAVRPQGNVMSGNAYSSGDRIAGVTIQADTLEEFNRKHHRFVEYAKVVDVEGKDIMRHDLLPDLE